MRADRGPITLLGLAGCLAAFAGYELVGGPTQRSGAQFGAGVLTIVGVLVGMRVNRLEQRLPWLMILVGLTLLAGGDGVAFVQIGLGHLGTVTSPLFEPFLLVGYLGILAGSTTCVLRHAPNDPGGVIDATVIGIGSAAPVWEFMIRPAMPAGQVAGGQEVLTLLQLLVLFGVLGSLTRMARTGGRGGTSIWLTGAAVLAGIVGQVVLVTGPAPDDPTASPYPGVAWTFSYLLFAGAALHPSAPLLTKPAIMRRDELSGVRLAYLGAFLAVPPLVGGIPQLFGQDPDGMLLSLGPLLITPLVLIRIWQLMLQRTRDQKRLAYQANHDELTGLANRYRMFLLIEEAIRAQAAGGMGAITVLYCDLDRFKPINDQFGHDAGDAVLRAVGQRLTGCLRAGDVIGRIGGDEFLALCPGAGPELAADLAGRVEAAAGDAISWQGETLALGISVGAATLDGGAVTADALIARADRDMYLRKNARRADPAPQLRAVAPDPAEPHPVAAIGPP